MSWNNSIAKNINKNIFTQSTNSPVEHELQYKDRRFLISPELLPDQQCRIYTPKSTEKPCIIHAYSYSISMLFINAWECFGIENKNLQDDYILITASS